MELSSKKVLPNGALAIVCHATEFPGGNGWARDIAYAALDALGPADEMGIVLWDGTARWLFPLAKVGDKKEMGHLISGMNPGDMADFQGPMQMAYEALKASTPTSNTWSCSATAIPARRRNRSWRTSSTTRSPSAP